MTSPPVTKWQKWMRAYSDLLVVSFQASAVIEHKVTKGEDRETQVIDILQILPRSVTPTKSVVIVDREGTESPKFDGALLDRDHLPLLFQFGPAATAMIESVVACVEVKSNLNRGEIGDIFRKSAKVHEMRLTPPCYRPPMVSGFAYRCTNLNLAFYDYARAFWSNRVAAPTPVCVLNQGVFVGASRAGANWVIDPNEQSEIPLLLGSGPDSLLAYLYLLFKRVSSDTPWASVARVYSDEFFGSATGFSFEENFLDRVVNNPALSDSARRVFSRRSSDRIDDIYREALVAIS